MQKILINKCFGGFRLSNAAYKRLIELGIPLRDYTPQKKDPVTGLYLPEPLNEGEVIFNPNEEIGINRLWDTWTILNRTHPLVIQVVEELGSEAASGAHAKLVVVEIPDGVEWTIEECDGLEHIAEKHRTWS